MIALRSVVNADLFLHQDFRERMQDGTFFDWGSSRFRMQRNDKNKKEKQAHEERANG